ncbi:hypothetical protein BM221_007835 [Beauveria bassiana]|uniref:Uncharacterized protein n=1 Tax=Beauveria bassiana TaxID=176275 RepID=A0A2N6NHS1_BEABA|nr:hypothetical protein BM221_007835 [Beauveria bassiana]
MGQHSDTVTDAIMVMPFGSASPKYRDDSNNFIGANSSDLMLINLAEAALKSANWPIEVQTGRDTFATVDDG